MVEQMADTLGEEYETEEQTISEGDVATSVSFGRFETDLLCWERWSSFSQNKYMEEIEKCSTPGAVARKKAFFEAHYKNIAAQKVELLEQEKQLQVDSLASDCPSNGSQTKNGCCRTIGFEELDSVELGNTTHINRQNGNGLGVDEQGLHTQEIQEVKKVVLAREENPLMGSQAKPQELPVLVVDENHSEGSQTQVENLPVCIGEVDHLTGSQKQLEEPPILIHEDNISEQTPSEGHSILVEGNYSSGLRAQLEDANDFVKDNNSAKPKITLKRHPNTSTAKVNKVGDSKLKLQKEPQKRTLASKDKNLARTKTKQLTATPKPAHASVSRASKPLLASPATFSSSKISARKESIPSILNKGSLSTIERRTTKSTSLDMSHNLGPTKSGLASFTTTRRSFIMENMGDKEIVRRAFKAFQSTGPVEASVRAGSSRIRQVSKNVTKQNISSIRSQTPRKDTERLVKRAGASKTRPEAAPSSFGVKSKERAEKQREFVNKLDMKSKANNVEKARLQSKPKATQLVKKVENEKQHHSLDIKATSPESYHG